MERFDASAKLSCGTDGVSSDAYSRRFLGVSALVFAITLALMIIGSRAMSAMGGMRMPGGWTMSMTWMRMPGQSWAGAVAMFLGMWIVMMIPMMLPALMPMLCRYRLARVRANLRHLDGLTAIVALGYFAVWAVIGLAVFVFGVAMANATMASPVLARHVPFAVGGLVILAGALQFTAWKARQLACCRATAIKEAACLTTAGPAWRHGIRLGLRCAACCSAPMAILLVIGIMDLIAMLAVTATITLERLPRFGEWAARTSGLIAILIGLALLGRAAGFA